MTSQQALICEFGDSNEGITYHFGKGDLLGHYWAREKLLLLELLRIFVLRGSQNFMRNCLVTFLESLTLRIY